MKPETQRQMVRHLVSVALVLAIGLVLSVAGMHPAAAAGVAGITVASIDGTSRWRDGRCGRQMS